MVVAIPTVTVYSLVLAGIFLGMAGGPMLWLMPTIAVPNVGNWKLKYVNTSLQVKLGIIIIIIIFKFVKRHMQSYRGITSIVFSILWFNSQLQVADINDGVIADKCRPWYRHSNTANIAIHNLQRNSTGFKSFIQILQNIAIKILSKTRQQ